MRFAPFAVVGVLLVIGCGGGGGGVGPGSSGTTAGGGSTAGSQPDSDPISDPNSGIVTSATISEFPVGSDGANGIWLRKITSDGTKVTTIRSYGPNNSRPAFETISAEPISVPSEILNAFQAIDAISGDGTTVAFPTYPGATVAKLAGGSETITPPQWITIESIGGLSQDGSTVAGTAYDLLNRRKPFVWTKAGGYVDLQTIDWSTDNVRGISADGHAVIGGDRSAKQWVDGGAPELVGPTGYRYTAANAVSQDGSVIVGDALLGATNAYNAYLWTRADGPRRLGHLKGFANISAKLVSGDGKLVVGTVWGPSPETPFVWTARGGIRLLRDVVSPSPALLNPNGPVRVSALTPDGRILIGSTFDNTGLFPEHAWVARLAITPPPPPGSK